MAKLIFKMTVWLMIAALPLYAGELAHTPGVFLDIGYGARSMGVGGAYTALSDDAYAMMWNPAGLCNVDGQIASFFYTRLFNLVPYTMAVYAGNAGGGFIHSEGIIVSGDDALTETTLLFATATKLDRIVPNLRLGATVKYKNATFGNNFDGGKGQVTGSAVGLGLDAGLIYPLGKKLMLGWVLRDMLDYLSWNSSAMGSYSQSNPVRMICGAAFRPFDNYVVTLDVDKSLYRDTGDVLRLGMERDFFDMLVLRGGLFREMSPPAATNFTLGGGFYYEKFDTTLLLDVAYVAHELENTLRFSVSMGF